MGNRLCALLTLVIAIPAFTQTQPANGAPDPAFSAIPFDNWLAGGDQVHFQWTLRVSGGQLTSLQRLGARVDVVVDGNELVRRRGPGQLMFFVKFSDTDHRVFQSHGAIDLKDVTEEAAKSNFVYTQNALVLPGTYRIDVAILNSNTGEHATLQKTLRVGPLRNDPLSDSERSLPPVEFTAAGDPPDVWFQPQLSGKLNVPLKTPRPARVEVLMNLSPAAIGPRSRASQANTRIVSDMLAGLKVFSQLEVSLGTLHVSLLDLSRRRVLFAQDQVDPRLQPLDWLTLRPALLEADPNKINVRDLADSRQNSQFFVEEVQRRISQETALIVMSGPVVFAAGDERHPVTIPEKTAGKVFYIRYHAEPPVTSVGAPLPIRPNRRGGLPRAGLPAQEPPDELGSLLKPLRARVFDVRNPEDFRRALAELMKDIERM